MTREERIESYSKGYDLLVQALNEMPEEMRQFKPAHDKWSVHEIIIHMADSEVNSYARARKFIAEPGSTVMAYDQDLLALKTFYHKQSIYDALELFRCLRRMTYNVIKNLPEDTWKNTIYHPENGIMTFDDWLITYEQHVPIHVNQMKRNLEEWKKLNS